MWFIEILTCLLTLANTIFLISIATFLVRWRMREQEEEVLVPSESRSTLDISEGDKIPENIINAQVPYHSRPVGKLDQGF